METYHTERYLITCPHCGKKTTKEMLTHTCICLYCGKEINIREAEQKEKERVSKEQCDHLEGLCDHLARVLALAMISEEMMGLLEKYDCTLWEAKEIAHSHLQVFEEAMRKYPNLKDEPIRKNMFKEK